MNVYVLEWVNFYGETNCTKRLSKSESTTNSKKVCQKNHISKLENKLTILIFYIIYEEFPEKN